MRFFLEFSYKGTNYCGYQEQPNSPSIQAEVEAALKLISKEEIKITGCGRTDTGVHALQYFAHFDAPRVHEKDLVYQLNAVLPDDIVIKALHEVPSTAHARFDATSRSYQYVIDTIRSPFNKDISYFCSYFDKLDIQKLQAAAELLLEYEDFTTFCKSRTDVQTKICRIERSEWYFNESTGQWIYYVTADRFLRGMIRLIVGMCLNVAKGKISILEVKQAMNEKSTLIHALSVPAQGLYLYDIKYPYIVS